LNLSEQRYLLWETASRSTKRQDMLEIWGRHGPIWPTLATPMFLTTCIVTAISVHFSNEYSGVVKQKMQLNLFRILETNCGHVAASKQQLLEA